MGALRHFFGVDSAELAVTAILVVLGGFCTTDFLQLKESLLQVRTEIAVGASSRVGVASPRFCVAEYDSKTVTGRGGPRARLKS